jgi:hypothetical protein
VNLVIGDTNDMEHVPSVTGVCNFFPSSVKFYKCDKFCIQWLLPCMDVLEYVMKKINKKIINSFSIYTG